MLLDWDELDRVEVLIVVGVELLLSCDVVLSVESVELLPDWVDVLTLVGVLLD